LSVFKPMRPFTLAIASIALAVAAAASGPATARRHDPEKLPVTRVRDLHYGDVLFYFYQGDDFEAITRLTAYQQWNLIPHHEDEGQLLLGGLYLALGMHNEAGQRFETLLTKDVPTGVRNRAWFYLAQVWYARGYLDKAEEALRKIQGKLSPELEAQKNHLFANVLMYEGKFDEAIQLLVVWKGTPTWAAYARFNLGVALVRKQRLSDADPFLTAVGTMYPETPELLALRDRANLALGFAYLQASQPERARRALERVRLTGPYSNKALLGTGWADAALGDYKAALNPWMELRGRNLLDAAVQESFLAVPYAFSKLNANAQSAEYYETAVQSYDAESVRLDDAITRIRSGNLLEQVISSERESRYGWFWQLKDVPDAPESRYLYTVLAGHDFQEGLKNYRDMVFMTHTLDRWGDSMEAFGDMIDTRERAYSERLPRVDALLASGAVEKLSQRRSDLESRVNAIESSKDVAALGSAEEREQWARVVRVEAALAVAPDTAENKDLRDRLRLVKGVLYFRLNDSFKARMWQQHRTIKDLDLALREAQNRWIRVDRARQSVPTNNGEFAARVAALKARIDGLQLRMAATEKKQSDYLAQVAVAELEQQKDRLATYQVQARFALATMYDRAANSDITHTEQGKPPTDQPPTDNNAPQAQQMPAPDEKRPSNAAPPQPPPPEPKP
jgi:tetratricopeptide (TPR) repeat protein